MKSLFSFFFFFFFYFGFSQNSINLNVSKSSKQIIHNKYIKGKPYKFITDFVLHPSIKTNRITIGTKINFNVKDLKNKEAVVVYKYTDVNKVTSYICKFKDSKYGEALLTVNTHEYFIKINIPEQNQYFKTITENKKEYYLAELDSKKTPSFMCSETHDDETFVIEPKIDIGSALKLKTNVTINNKSKTIKQEGLDHSRTSSLPPGCVDFNEDDPAEIKILIVYTQEALNYAKSQEAMDNLIASAILQANNVSLNSNLGINFVLAHSTLVNYTEAATINDDLSRLRNEDDDYLQNVSELKNTHYADLVHLFVNRTGAGKGYTLNKKAGDKRSGYGVTPVQRVSDNDYTFVHELGHNLGAGHAKEQVFNPGPSSFSQDWAENTWTAGWRFKGNDDIYYCDIMTYDRAKDWEDGIKPVMIPYFSSPQIFYKGQPMGHIEHGDNVRTLRTVKHAVSKYSDSISQRYCSAEGESGAGSWNLSITNVSLNTLNNSSQRSNYSDFSLKRTGLVKGSEYELKVTVGGASRSDTNQLFVWVDWNDDGVFENNENVYSSPNGRMLEFATNLAVPLTAITGEVRMRVRYHFASGTTNTTPCGIASYGEVEDYTLCLFEAHVAINAESSPTNGGTISGGGNYNFNDSVTLVANPNSGYDFINWTENSQEVSDNPIYTFTANQNRNLVANFSENTISTDDDNLPELYMTINAESFPTNGGTISGGGNYNFNDSVTLVANPNSGYDFINWTENSQEVSDNSIYTFTANQNRNLVANFTESDDDNLPLKFKMYPNPTFDFIRIESNLVDIDQIRIYDILGRLIFENSYNNKTVDVNISQFSKGMYFIRVFSGVDSHTKKVFKF